MKNNTKEAHHGREAKLGTGYGDGTGDGDGDGSGSGE